MEQTSSPIRTIDLANGLVLNIYDRSRQIAADRFKVEVVDRIEIPVKADGPFPQRVDEGRLAAMQALLGDSVVFEKTTTRHFVSARDKDAVVAALCAHTARHLVPYYAHPGFAPNFLLKTFAERS